MDQRRLRAVDRVAENRDELRVGDGLLYALRHDGGLVAPKHVTGSRLADKRLAVPAFELLSVPGRAGTAELHGAVEELDLSRRGVDLRVEPEVESQPSGCAFLGADDQECGEWQLALAHSPGSFGPPP